MTEIRYPLFISSRLMAAYRIPGAGVVHLHAVRRDDEYRVVYRHVIENAVGDELATGEQLTSGVAAEPDYTRAMADMLGYLAAAGDSYGYHETTENDGNFPTDVQVWAYMNLDRLSMAACELEETLADV